MRTMLKFAVVIACIAGVAAAQAQGWSVLEKQAVAKVCCFELLLKADPA